MGGTVGINIQVCNDVQQAVHHSIRETAKPISYLMTDPHTLTNFFHGCDKNTDWKNRELMILDDYKKHQKRALKKDTKLYQEGVIWFTPPEHFESCKLDEIQKSLDDFCKSFEKEHGCKILMSSLHLDEGHKESGKHNYHAHILVENYSFDTHKTCLQKLDYRKLQGKLADQFHDLGFERGDPERHAVRLEHAQYRQMKTKQSKIEQEIKYSEQVQKDVKPLIKVAYEINPKIKTYADITTTIVDDLDTKTQELDRLKLLEQQYKSDRQALKDSHTATQKMYSDLKKEYEMEKEKLEKELQQARLERDSALLTAQTVQSELDTVKNASNELELALNRTIKLSHEHQLAKTAEVLLNCELMNDEHHDIDSKKYILKKAEKVKDERQELTERIAEFVKKTENKELSETFKTANAEFFDKVKQVISDCLSVIKQALNVETQVKRDTGMKI